MKLRSALATAALVAVSIPTLSGTAEARGLGFHGGWGGHHGGWGWGGVGLGLATGALVGAALTAPYYSYGYSYPYDYYAYDYGYPVAYDYRYAPTAYTVGYVGPYWGGYRRHWVRRPYAYHVGYRSYGGRVAYHGYSRAAFRSYGAMRTLHHGRFR